MEKINVEVAYATSFKQVLIPLAIPVNTDIIEAIKLSQIVIHCPELENVDFTNIIGIFGKKVSLDYKLQDRDRIEIYRPLAKTPNQRRLERAMK